MSAAIEIPRHWSSTFLSNKTLSEVRMYLRHDKSFVTEFNPHPGAEGPKAHAHGGFLASILDETMGSACWYNGLPVLAANLSVKYRRSVPLAGHYLCEAKIDRLETRRAMVNARIYKDDTVYCEATGVFVRVPIELLKQQPDMARMVEVVESIKSGQSIEELIELDRARRAGKQVATEAAPAGDDWQALAERGQKLAGDILSLAGDVVGRWLR
ncbi:PaaI family thioesterase [Turneriella parva]|uniref:Acyl-coenzyme A thioesterase THEM4 n=1 Tax=Turneriella parva (strain ATCC BAA-1111 / DSM 21527 / NCTC 11395 / H) TaxID=869212 RepID=I4B3B2_TURPD|nr:PaaI family thioesterase [Turneriella parva]AFM11769.1 thioesterase superfamily protein [Turneriella parva DSM 21527]